MAQKTTVANTMKMLDSFLGQFRKTAEESNTQTVDLQDLEQNDEVTDSQTNLGEEQAAAAADGGSTIDSTPANSDGAAEQTYPESIPELDADATLEENSEVLGTVTKTVAGEESEMSKMARAERIGNALLNVITSSFEKTASAKKAAKKPLTREEQVFQKMASVSAAAAQDYYESHLLGQIQRVQDEQDLSQARLHPQVLRQFGGVGGLLNKVAEEMPEAVLPEGMAELPPEVAEEGMPEGMPEEAPVEDPAAAGGEVGEGDIEQLASALEQAGVSPEDLEQAFQDVQQLQEAGVTPDELAAAVEEINTGAGAEGGAEMPAEAAPEELPAELPEELPAEMPMGEEKTAFDRSRIEAIKQFLRG